MICVLFFLRLAGKAQIVCYIPRYFLAKYYYRCKSLFVNNFYLWCESIIIRTLELEDKYNEQYLIAQLKAHDITAFEIIYKKYSGKLYNFVLSILYNKSLAQDITQNSFLKIWEKRESLDPTKSFSSYLFTIARNLVYKESERLILDYNFIEHERSYTNDITNNTEENIDASFLDAYIDSLVDNLPHSRKQIFKMRKHDKLSNKEIAAKLNISEKTVETQIYRSLQYLKEKLKDYSLIFLL